MAYGVVISQYHLGGPDWLIVIVETDAGPATEATITGLPKKGRILTQTATKTGGAATTLAPYLSKASGSAAAIDIIVQATAAADQSNSFDAGAQYETTGGTLYHRSICDSGLSAVVTQYRIKAGW